MISGAASRWEDLTWPQLGERVVPAAVVLIPVGATEQHGPHLPTSTDTVIARAIAEAAAPGTAAVVTPAIAIGCSYGHGRRLPGTLSLTPEQLVAVAVQHVEWGAMSGFRRFLFVNAHYGNATALSMATDRLRFERPDLQVGQLGWWELDPELTRELTLDGADGHANRAETAVMLHVAPELVDTALIADADDEDRTNGLAFRYTADALSRNGVTGRPSEATAELGATLFDLAVTRLTELIVRAGTEAPPLP